MITIDYISSLTNERSFERGRAIAKSIWQIKLFQVREQESIDHIDAAVVGNQGEYSIEIVYDTDTDRILKIYCECPAFGEHGHICKHTVAVLLSYKAYCERQIFFANLTNRTDKMSRYVHEVKQSRKTSPQMKELLEQQARVRLAPYQQKDIIGQVRLEPYLTFEDGQAYLEFKIGSTQMYVLKDVFEFVEHMRKNRDFCYGKKLQFTHTLDVFEEKSKKMVAYLENWVRSHEKYYIQTNYYHGYGMGQIRSKIRNIPLDGVGLEEFLEILNGTPVMVNGTTTKVSYEQPDRLVEIVGLEEGIEVKFPKVFQYVGKKYQIYVLDKGIYCVLKQEENLIQKLYDCAQEAGERGIYIQNEDVPGFCKEFLPVLEEKFECIKKDFDVEKYIMNSVKFKLYFDMPQDDYITCRVDAVYGDKIYHLMDKESEKHSRNMLDELEVEQRIAPWFNAFNPETKEWVLAEDEEMLYELLTKGFQQFQGIGEVFLSDAIKKLKAHSSKNVNVGVALSGNLLELKMSVDDIPQEELLDILCRYQKRKRFYRMKDGTFLNIEDDRIKTLSELKQGLGLKDSELKQEKILLPKYRALFLEPLVSTKDKEYKSLVRNMKTIEDSDFEIPKQVEDILRAYQKRGFLWIKTLKQNGFGGILADEMGLGKTLQVIAFLMSERKRSLIVTPASLVYNWRNEIQHFASHLSVKVVIGTAKERKEIIQRAGEDDILITSYDLLKRDLEYYKGVSFANQIVDEAQYIKNHGTQAAQAVRQIEADFRLALTGTPVENRLSELWSIFDYLMPGFLFPYAKFRKELELPIVHGGDEEASLRLQKMVRPFILRRLKKEVLTDLPDKLEKNMYAKMEEEQQKLYDAHVKRLKLLLAKQSEQEFKNSKFAILSELTKLRQLCCYPGLIYEGYPHMSAKEQLCMELIENAIEGNHKVLLFSQFTTMLERLQKHMDEKKIKYCVLTGATSKEKRNQMVTDFEKNDVSVFCISLKAGGTGLNLTAADIVIHYDPWWNLAVQNQATDRAHRIGQEQVVSVYKLIAEGTIEENIVKLQEKKKELSEQILSGEDMGTGKFDRQELLELLGNKL